LPADEEPFVRVTCPGCTLCCVVPAHLLGEGGARITCPACGTTYVVDAAGVPVGVETSYGDGAPVVTPREPADAAARVPGAGRTLALERLQVLDRPPGAMASAAGRGRLFAEFGPAVLDAFETWRGIVGAVAEPTVFLEALHELTAPAVQHGFGAPAHRAAVLASDTPVHEAARS